MPEQVFIQCTVGGPIRVYVKDGVITRMRPSKTRTSKDVYLGEIVLSK
jgi:anaerobic selenocysteine-containing dehydrogenase